MKLNKYLHPLLFAEKMAQTFAALISQQTFAIFHPIALLTPILPV